MDTLPDLTAIESVVPDGIVEFHFTVVFPWLAPRENILELYVPEEL